MNNLCICGLAMSNRQTTFEANVNGIKLINKSTIKMKNTSIKFIGLVSIFFLTKVNGNTELRGNLRCTKIVVNPKWWPDYVFAPEYKLMSLREVRSFIQANKHLPGMPPQDSVTSGGQDIGQLQILQQQKIEELTLYAIEQDKTIANQSSELQAQKSELEAQKKLLDEQAKRLKALEEALFKLKN